MRLPETNEDLTGKVGVCSAHRGGVIVGPGEIETADGVVKGWKGIGFDGKGTWFSTSPVITHESVAEYHDYLQKRFGGKLSHLS